MKKKVSYRHIVVATMDLRLLLFLIEKGVLTKFLDNCRESSKCCCSETLSRKRVIRFEDYFIWAHTPQGWRYWNNLYDDFYA